MMNIYNHPQALYHRFTYFYYTEFHNKDHIFNYCFFPNYHSFQSITTQISSQTAIIYMLFIFLDLLNLYENHNIQEKNLSEKMNKIDVHLSNKYRNMKLNFNTLQYFYVLEQNDMNNEQNAELLSLSNSKHDWFRLCYALLNEYFDNKVCFENNNIKAFHHAFLYHCGYPNKDSLIQEIQKIKTRKEQNPNYKQSSINNIDHPKGNNQNQNEDKNIETIDNENGNNDQNQNQNQNQNQKQSSINNTDLSKDKYHNKNKEINIEKKGKYNDITDHVQLLKRYISLINNINILIQKQTLL